MIVTKEFVLAVVEGIQALRRQAQVLADEPQFANDDGVGRILRTQQENNLQSADILAGWVRRRSLNECGVNPEDFDI